MASRTRGRLAVVRTAALYTPTRRTVVETTARVPIVAAVCVPEAIRAAWNVVPLCPRDAPLNVIFLDAARAGRLPGPRTDVTDAFVTADTPPDVA